MGLFDDFFQKTRQTIVAKVNNGHNQGHDLLGESDQIIYIES